MSKTPVIVLILILFQTVFASKLNTAYSESQLKKNCYQTNGKLKEIPPEKREKLCACIAKKTYERLRKPTDLIKEDKLLILQKTNEFFTNPKKKYSEDPFSVYSELFVYTDECLKDDQ